MTDAELMAQIHKQWTPLLDSAEKTSGIPAAFFAALIANETGGNPDATRFEPAVFTALAEVLLGRKAAYGSLGAQDLFAWAAPTPIPNDGTVQSVRAIFNGGLKRLADIATSWGLLQIMGYEAITFRATDGVAALRSPVSELTIAVLMLKDFARRNSLDVTKNFSELFDCWNTGRPHAPTFDPQYIPNGLARMSLYQSLAPVPESAT
jgi:hypothetical protein